MKRSQVWFLAVVAAMFVGSLSAQTSQMPTQTVTPQTSAPAEPSLGSYARNMKKEKKQEATKRFDNDNLPHDDKLSVVGNATDSAAAAPTSDNASEQKDSKLQNAAAPTVTPGQSPEERQQVYEQWKGKLSDQQAQVDKLSQAMDLEQREYKLRAAQFYGDAGERLRNQAGWDKQDAEYKQKLADEQKALDDAKQKLDDMHEDARKAGVPSSVTEGQPPNQ